MVTCVPLTLVYVVAISPLPTSIHSAERYQDFMSEIKGAIKQYHPEVYDKLFMYDVGESAGATESLAKEGDAELEELKGMLGRSGVMGLSN